MIEAIQSRYWGCGENMSRLYAWIESDTGRGGNQEKTITGKKWITITLNYGSSKISKRACSLHVSYPEDAENPTIHFSETI